MYTNHSDYPSWKSVMVNRHLPVELSGLETLCKNLWWCWNESAKELFESIDKELWRSSYYNPMAILDKVSIKRFNELAKNREFLEKLDKVMREFNAYMAEKEHKSGPSIAYFCMEYGLDASLSIYSGGLGILAGDYLKEVSDMNVDLVAVGLLYRNGYFTQRMTSQGKQDALYEAQNFGKTAAQPVLDENGSWKMVKMAMPGRDMYARIWKVAVGRTDLYLLDTDFEANCPEDRQVTHELYGGDWENRLKQEILLGIGGTRALRILGLNPTIYHCNEGHAAFMGLERLREFMVEHNMNFFQALEMVRASGLYTTHTPVPAGHDSFDDALLGRFMGHYPQRFGIDWRTMVSLGKLNPDDTNEKFNMSILAANTSQNVNGVSKLHGEVSQKIFANMYTGYLPEELYISYVTNGVHYPTWAAPEWKKIHERVFGPEFKTHHYDKKCFEGIYNVDDAEIWETRKVLKRKLMTTIRHRLADPVISAHYTPKQKITILERYDENALTIGFARRFATYKRATLLFKDLDRLDSIVNNPKRPVQFIFAGKAHPADGMGQDFIRQVIEISKQERFLGKIIFVPGYNITLAKRMVQGVDIWMNNPTRPLEASGTSGEKAAMNGVMHFSVLDGWWVEGYRKDAGWALPQEQTYEDNTYQDELDAATIYALLENEIVPSYYDVDKATGRSDKWIGFIKNTIAKVACNFTTNRMLTDYINQYYVPQSERYNMLAANGAAKAKELQEWKNRLNFEWNNIKVVSYKQPEASYELTQNEKVESELVLDLGRIRPEDIGVEMVFCTVDRKGDYHIKEVSPFEFINYEGSVARFKTSILPETAGMYEIGTRIYATHPMLPHRQDFPFVKWIQAR